MRSILFCITLVALCTKIAASPDLQVIRQQYLKAIEEKTEAYEMHKLMKNIESDVPVIKAYKASSKALIARYSYNPYTKVQKLKNALEEFDQAVYDAPRDVEVRFLRFAVQYHLPEFLGLSDNVEKDRKFLIKRMMNPELNQKPAAVQKVIGRFLLNEVECQEQVEARIQACLTQL